MKGDIGPKGFKGLKGKKLIRREDNSTTFVCLVVFNVTFQQHFSYIMAVSFIGGGNRRTRRKPPTCH
jgi:hypothetical protein